MVKFFIMEMADGINFHFLTDRKALFKNSVVILSEMSILFLQFLPCLQLYQSQVQRLACIFSPIFGTPGPGAGPLHYYKYKQYYIAYTFRFSGFCGEKNIWPWVLMSNDMPHPK